MPKVYKTSEKAQYIKVHFTWISWSKSHFLLQFLEISSKILTLMRTLENLGLTEKQNTVYLTVLELGTCTMSEIAQKAAMKRPTTYIAVDELLMLGLITQKPKGKRKYYSAVHPRRLLEIAKNQERQIQEIFPKLVALHNAPKDRPKIHTIEYSYTEGVNQLYAEIEKWLEEGKEAIAFTDMKAFKNFPDSIKLYKKMLKRLKNPHIRELNFGNKEGLAWIKEIKPLQGKNHFIRTLPIDFPYEGTDNLIFNDKVVICSLQKEIFIIVIESKNIADTYRALFEWAWKAAEI